MTTKQKSQMMSSSVIDRASLVDECKWLLVRAFGGKRGKKLYDLMANIPTDWAKIEFTNTLIDGVNSAGTNDIADLAKWRVVPVSIREFICSPFYLDKADEVYPEVLKELEIMNNGEYVEVVHTGGIGSAKTTGALYSQAYQLYILSCMTNPHQSFGLDSSSEILIVFQSLNAKLAKTLDYARFRALIEHSPYFANYFPFRKDIESRLDFPNRISVVPISGSETGAIGQNVIGGILDEVNFMAVVQNSKQGANGSGVYDQAHALYSSISRRRKTRFSKQGKLYGLLCLVSSKRFPNQFTDVKTQEAQHEIATTGKSRIYVYDKRVWDVKPRGSFGKETFPIFIGDDSRKPRLITEEEYLDLKKDSKSVKLLDRIPMEFYSDFKKDMIKSLQDIAGHSTLAKHPFLMNTEAVAACFKDTALSVIDNEYVDFVLTKAAITKSRILHKQFPRFVHIDLSLTGDSTGVACGYVDGFVNIDRGDTLEVLPNIVFDFVLEVRPPSGGEINYAKIRQIIYTLTALGMPVKWVTLDSYQSNDMIQLLRAKGYIVGQTSMDTSTQPYEYLKSALYDGRVTLPLHPLLKTELLSLEKDTKRNKIDHPATSSKDCADAVAGVVYGLTTRKHIWQMFNVSFLKAPLPIQGYKDNLKKGEPNE